MGLGCSWRQLGLTNRSHGFCSLQEFEVIAQIKLLQSACNNYSFTREDQFVDWFHSLERLSEAER